MESDEALFERMRRGDLAAFDALYRRWERRIYGFVRGYLDDSAEAEDVFHEIFMTVLRAPADFARGSFKAWVLQVARNASLNRLRSRRRGESAYQRQGQDVAASVVVPTVVDEIAEREAARALARAVAGLPRTLGEIYRLRAAGLSYEEMATVLEVPLGTVKSRMHEMVSQLKKEMQTWTASG
jgi:RNA polymerase sigma-70 factor (ECF subfamily)